MAYVVVALGSQFSQPPQHTVYTFSTTTGTTFTEHGGSCTRLNDVERIVTSSTTSGPTVIVMGEEQSVTCFVAANRTNTNINVHRQFFVDRVPCTTAPAMSLWGYAGLAALLLAVPMAVRRRRPAGAG